MGLPSGIHSGSYLANDARGRSLLPLKSFMKTSTYILTLSCCLRETYVTGMNLTKVSPRITNGSMCSAVQVKNSESEPE